MLSIPGGWQMLRLAIGSSWGMATALWCGLPRADWPRRGERWSGPRNCPDLPSSGEALRLREVGMWSSIFTAASRTPTWSFHGRKPIPSGSGPPAAFREWIRTQPRIAARKSSGFSTQQPRPAPDRCNGLRPAGSWELRIDVRPTDSARFFMTGPASSAGFAKPTISTAGPCIPATAGRASRPSRNPKAHPRNPRLDARRCTRRDFLPCPRTRLI